MTKQIPGQNTETPATQMTFGIERLVPESDRTAKQTNVTAFPLQAVSRFAMEDMSPSDDVTDIFVTREIERLVSNGSYNQAYDLYLSDAIYDVPESFREFLNSLIGCDTLDE